MHFLQIWSKSKELNVNPSYEQKNFAFNKSKNKFVNIVSGDKRNDSVYIHQDAIFSIGSFDKNKEMIYELKNHKNGILVFVIKGNVDINKGNIKDGDSAEITETEKINIKTNETTNRKIILVERLSTSQ